MNGKSNEEIEKVKKEAIEEVKIVFEGEEITVIDSFIKDAPHEANPLWYLGQSILLLSTADIAYFAKGWKNARGCIIENICATEYNLLSIETN
jgi:hypothetical protein